MYYLALLMMAACTSPESKEDSKTTGLPEASALEGSWELVENVVKDTLVKPVRTQQLKIFKDGFF